MQQHSRSSFSQTVRSVSQVTLSFRVERQHQQHPASCSQNPESCIHRPQPFTSTHTHTHICMTSGVEGGPDCQDVPLNVDL